MHNGHALRRTLRRTSALTSFVLSSGLSSARVSSCFGWYGRVSLFERQALFAPSEHRLTPPIPSNRCASYACICILSRQKKFFHLFQVFDLEQTELLIGTDEAALRRSDRNS